MANLFFDLRLSEQEIEEFHNIKRHYEQRFGKQTQASVFRFMIKEKNMSIMNQQKKD